MNIEKIKSELEFEENLMGKWMDRVSPYLEDFVLYRIRFNLVNEIMDWLCARMSGSSFRTIALFCIDELRENFKFFS